MPTFTIKHGGRLHVPPGQALRVGDVQLVNPDAAPASVKITDAGGAVVFEADVPAAGSVRLNGTALAALAAGDCTVAASGGVNGTLAASPVNPDQ